jgi:riboflavin kinase/FMN adenylyltransferase
MKTLSWEEFASGSAALGPIAATIGVFDGLHIGHQALIATITGMDGLSSVVFTFKENPKRILAPSAFQGELSTLERKLELIESLGVRTCVLIDFSGDFSKLPGRQFLSLLVGRAELRFLAVGANFKCGHRLDTDAEGIRAFCSPLGIGFASLQAVGWGGHPVSSSRIRLALREGRLEEAQAMLGRPYELDLDRPSQVQPPAGTYEARSGEGEEVLASLDGEGRWTVRGFADEAGLSRPAKRGRLALLRLVSRV